MKVTDAQWISRYQNAPLSLEALQQQASTSYYVDFMRTMGMNLATCDRCGDIVGYGQSQSIENGEVEHALTGCNGRLR